MHPLQSCVCLLFPFFQQELRISETMFLMLYFFHFYYSNYFNTLVQFSFDLKLLNLDFKQ